MPDWPQPLQQSPKLRLEYHNQCDQSHLNGLADDVVQGIEPQCIRNIADDQQHHHSLDHLGHRPGTG